ncbi:MAG: hypothetical protein HYT70_03675 [Candidatus Aenigmarchaeota archaeon]|nr:hypothetical protein [Candidatus Aenigmarchaeota archaeon]
MSKKDEEKPLYIKDWEEAEYFYYLIGPKNTSKNKRLAMKFMDLLDKLDREHFFSQPLVWKIRFHMSKIISKMVGNSLNIQQNKKNSEKQS